MALVHWKPSHKMQDLQREMNHLFEDMLAPATRDNGFRAAFSPAAELQETEEAYQLKLEIPGLELSDIDIEVTAEAVSIRGERKTETKEEKEGVTRTEFRYGHFQRVIPLPGRINNQNISAEYKNGILHLALPKAEEEKNRVVKVSLN